MNLFEIGRIQNNTPKEPETAIVLGRRIPIAYREMQTDSVVCPYCLREHDHGTADGHRSSHCSSTHANKVWNMDGGWFTPADGYVVMTRKRHTQPDSKLRIISRK